MPELTEHIIIKPFGLRGKVIHGYGRQLGNSATVELNEESKEELTPYINLVIYGWGCVVNITEENENEKEVNNESEVNCKGPFPFSMSLGYNPHFKDTKLTAEVHFLHKFNKNFYGAIVKIIGVGAVREMKAYNSMEELSAAIKEDIKQTREALQKPEFEKYKKHPFVEPKYNSSEVLPYFEVLE